MIAKSKTREGHVHVLRKFFERLRKYKMRLNPQKCTFGVTADRCQAAFPSIQKYLQNPPILMPPTPGKPLILYLSVNPSSMGCLLAQKGDKGVKKAIYYLKFDLAYITRKFVKGRAVEEFLADHPVDGPEDSDFVFPDEEVLTVVEDVWTLYFDGATNQKGYGIGVLLITPDGSHIPLAFKLNFDVTNNQAEYEVCIVGMEAALILGVKKLEVIGDSNLVVSQANEDRKVHEVKLKLYHQDLEDLIPRFYKVTFTHIPRLKNQFTDALATLASMVELPLGVKLRPILIKQRDYPAYHGKYPAEASKKDQLALRRIAAQYILCGGKLYKRSHCGMHKLCVNGSEATRIMEEVHEGVCGPHMSGVMLARKILRQGIDVIGMVKSSALNGHRFILVAIDYFTKVLELFEEFGIQVHHSTVYRPQTNGAVEATNKNIETIIKKSAESARDWHEQLPLALWGYRTSIHTSTRATPYSLVYGMDAVLPIELEESVVILSSYDFPS
ncbi:uncharacterized protein LOC131313879 [Rhododendron vialii]|uniref:uncharacterized protein LOC131313879 n=1 Tax=Rhododendron vialii TaxID=182163 RepID=UPI00265FBB84|nr:uncharacterized protein LOC131313879 [Rhododendron vialii]